MYISVYNLWIINLALPLFTEDSLKCLYQARRVSGHVYVLGLKCLYQARRVSGHVYVLGLKCLYQARRVSGHVYVLGVSW
jgi:hypothetical protein